MGVARVAIKAQQGSQWRDLQRKLRAAGAKDLRAELRKQVNQAAKPVLDEVKQTVRTLPVKTSSATNIGVNSAAGRRRAWNASRARSDASRARAERGGGGLRETTANATRLQQTTNGVRFTVNSSKLPEDQRNLPRHLDAEDGWRHPVFGNRHLWVAQKGKPWFATTIQKRAPKFRQAVLEAVDKINDELER